MSLHKSEGYSIILASPFEVGLMRHGTIVKTWKLGAFNDRMPDIDHPSVQEVITAIECVS